MKTVDYRPRLRWDDRLGLEHGSVERIVHSSESWRQAQTGLLPVAAYWQDVATQLKLSPDELNQLQTDFFSGDQLDTDIVNYLRQRRATGTRIALLSNDSPTLQDKLARLDIADLFDPLVISANIGVMKPDRRAYLYVLQQMNRLPEQTIFIDDMLYNIEAAQALGIHTVHYTAGMDLIGALESLR